ncbi:hypothetical protein [Xaviernesmea oryzae]|uniref:Uncharacterized protein n=1 Tax=Xaviernesmea oryzae TaxID=464029 RepID=A0A1X7FU68_9HYPH|nr:hypothetical protein [Xaviernesmea oryzae]SMF58847.1 hypothetical protein SAMN02982989_0847 [Xaviernesmea oryzae]
MTGIGNFSDTEAQLSSGESGSGYGSSVLSSPTAKMDFLRGQLAQRGFPSEGMSWTLLMLEWKYDLAVLFGNLGDWMRYIDRRFDFRE